LQIPGYMNRIARHRFLQRLFWSPPGLAVVQFYRKAVMRWEHVVMNRSLFAECNGEFWLCSLLPEEPTVLDVGFNRGDFSREVVRQRPKARVVGFDPSQIMQALFRQDFDGEKRIELIPYAASDRESKLGFCDLGNGNSAVAADAARETSTCQVDAIRLDDFVEARGWEQIDLLKIDAEGHDLNVIEGASRLLDRQVIAMFSFEFNAPWIDSRRFLKEACSYIESKPYRVFRLFNGFLVPFKYSHTAERHDLGCNYVGVSQARLSREDIVIRDRQMLV